MKKLNYVIIVLAWVLWIRTQGPAVNDWTGAGSFATQQQCLANLKEKLDTWKHSQDARFVRNMVIFTGNNTTMTYYCLPDGEDPRKSPIKGAP